MTANLQLPEFDLELFLQTNFNPEERYQAIDGHVRTWYRTVMSWPYVARYCDLVEKEKLYELGGFETMTAWLQNAAPRCERSLREYREIRGLLSEDFTDAEMSEMKKESAKFIAKSVTSHEHRRNPKVRAAAKKDKADCVKDVREELPELHLEDLVNIVFTDSQMESIRPILEWYKMKEGDPAMTTPEAIEGALEDYRALRERLDSIETDSSGTRDIAWQR